MENYLKNDNDAAYVDEDKYITAEQKIDKITAQAKERVRDLKAIEKNVIKLRNAQKTLEELWDIDVMQDNYPFEQSFDEIDLDSWVRSIKNKIQEQLNELCD